MGLLDGQSQQNYYNSDNHGNYQFVSLKDVINQFMVVYVGEEKLIRNANETDVAFHAQILQITRVCSAKHATGAVTARLRKLH